MNGITPTRSRGVKLVVAALVLLVTLAWATTAGRSSSVDDAEAPAVPARFVEAGTEPRKAGESEKAGEPVKSGAPTATVEDADSAGAAATETGEKATGSKKASRSPGLDGFRSGGPDLPVMRLVLTLVVLLGVVGIGLWVARRIGGARFGRFGLGGGNRLQLLGRLPLGGRRGLVLVRAAGRLLVLGVSEAGVQKVLERDDSEMDPESFAGALDEAAGGEAG